MNDSSLTNRIVCHRRILNGKPRIRHHNLSIEYILEMLATGETITTLQQKHHGLELEDIQACLWYAKRLLEHTKPSLSHDDLFSLIPEILKQVPYLNVLVLFGSRARGDANLNSDWDFAFLCDEEERKQYEKKGFDSFRVWWILQDIYELEDEKIDVIDLKSCSEIMAHEVAKEGVLIYERYPGIFTNFQTQRIMDDKQLKAYREKTRNQTLATLKSLKHE